MCKSRERELRREVLQAAVVRSQLWLLLYCVPQSVSSPLLPLLLLPSPGICCQSRFAASLTILPHCCHRLRPGDVPVPGPQWLNTRHVHCYGLSLRILCKVCGSWVVAACGSVAVSAALWRTEAGPTSHTQAHSRAQQTVSCKVGLVVVRHCDQWQWETPISLLWQWHTPHDNNNHNLATTNIGCRNITSNKVGVTWNSAKQCPSFFVICQSWIRETFGAERDPWYKWHVIW